jgi:hypothetical protein
MAADHPQHHCDCVNIGTRKAGQPHQQLACLGRAERTDGDAAQVGLGPRHGIAARDQQAAVACAFHEGTQICRHIIVEEYAAAGRQIRLEVIEHQEDAFLRQHLPEQLKAEAVIKIWLGQDLTPPARWLAARLRQRLAKGERNGDEVETATMCRHQPAVLGETAHDAARNGALAGAADPAQNDPGVLPPGVAQAPQRVAQFLPAADQVVDTQLRNRPLTS